MDDSLLDKEVNDVINEVTLVNKIWIIEAIRSILLISSILHIEQNLSS